MRRMFLFISIFGIAISLLIWLPQQAGHAARDVQLGEPIVREKPVTNAGRFLIKLKPGVTTEHIQERLARALPSIMGGEVKPTIKTFHTLDRIAAIVFPGLENQVYEGLPPQLFELRRILGGLVEYVEPDYRVSIEATPNDPDYSSLWGLQQIDAEAAWDLSTGSSDVYVVVIDTGIDYTHPDLAANMAQLESNCADGIDNDGNGHIDDCFGYDAVNDDSDPMDGNGHGTHVAGTIGAVGNNSVGVVGVNWTVKLIACKFLSDDGWGWTGDAVECLDYVHGLADNGVAIIATNNSWGGGGYSQALYDAIYGSLTRGILFIAAAGNESTNIDERASYPAAYDLPNVISVAATDAGDYLTSFSNWGKRNVDLGAPGLNILSTLPGNNYGSYSGTSMAAPHVTGVAALTKAYIPTASAEQIRNRILLGVDTPVGDLADRVMTGGRLNAANTLTLSGVNRLWGAFYPNWLLYRQDFPVQALSIDENGSADWVMVNGTSLSGGTYGWFSGIIPFPSDWVVETEDSFGNLNSEQIDSNAHIGYAAGYIIDGPSAVGAFDIGPDKDGDLVTPEWSEIRLKISDYDEACQEILLPFAVRLYGYPIKRLNVCTNGVIAAYPIYYTDQNDPNFPLDSAPFYVIAPLSMDFVPGLSSQPDGGVYLKYSENQVIIEWRAVPEWNCIGIGSDCEVTFQVVMNREQDRLVFQYIDTTIDAVSYSVPPLVGVQWFNLESPYSTPYCDSDTSNTVPDCDLEALNGQMLILTPNYEQIFNDIPTTHPDQYYISRLYLRRWTDGCGGGNYCPDSNLTRAQMVTFLIRILEGEDFPYSTTPYFEDVPATHWAFKYIQRASEIGLTSGCGDPDDNGIPNFCPNDILSKAQIITFLVRSEFGNDFAYSSEPYFDDVPSTHWAFKYIQKGYEMGIAQECGYRLFCPNDPVSRAAMARFLITWQEE
ncbi:MAG: S8 family serine peptidase [Chloroflexi bacterium]|nr:S8 family serine peptidase [Chloroflexota bacterium]